MENNKYQVLYTPLAYNDLDEIDSYISETLCNTVAAENLMAEIENAVGQLEQFPYLGSEVTAPHLSRKGYRKLVVNNYLIFYLIDVEQKNIIIMRVLYGAREYHNLL